MVSTDWQQGGGRGGGGGHIGWEMQRTIGLSFVMITILLYKRDNTVNCAKQNLQQWVLCWRQGRRQGQCVYVTGSHGSYKYKGGYSGIIREKGRQGYREAIGVSVCFRCHQV